MGRTGIGRRSQSGEGPSYRSPALLMTVRREIAEPRRESGAWSPEDRWVLVQYVEGSRGESDDRRPRRSSGSAIAAEVFMNNAGGLTVLG